MIVPSHYAVHRHFVHLFYQIYSESFKQLAVPNYANLVNTQNKTPAHRYTRRIK